jgi:hypothetical protein
MNQGDLFRFRERFEAFFMSKLVQYKQDVVKRANNTTKKRKSRLKQPKPRKQTIKQLTYRKPAGNNLQMLLLSLEVLGMVIAAVAVIMVLLGYLASWFSSTGFFVSLLPFAVVVLGLIVITAAFLLGWLRFRKILQHKSLFLPSAISLGFAVILLVMLGQFSHGIDHFRALVGGRQEDRRITLAHQVYANYRRFDPVQIQKMIERAQQYFPVIKEAAQSFDIDVNLLQGLAAAESSYLPRESRDGGKGLFQITQVPDSIMTQASRRLAVNKISLMDPRHNAFVAAAALKFYLSQMKNNLFLGLLAYNIGPANGGLRFIMKEYGATSFVTIQPYLQQLPRDYPIRVLSYSLAFRLWQREGKLLAYEEGKNARRIQRIGIPGLKAGE